MDWKKKLAVIGVFGNIGFATAQQQATVYTTAKGSGKPMAQTQTLRFTPYKQPLEKEAYIFLDASRSFQEMTGIGGAVTDAAAETFAKLPAAQQQELLTAYYDPTKGIGYTIARTNINSCDFSSDMYVYVQDKDSALKTFSIAHDLQYKVPLLQRVVQAAGGNGKIKLFASPWTPPAWMKDNKDLQHGGKLLPQYRKAWTAYYIKFLKTYAAQGLAMWGLTVQNEPMASQRWESCIFTAEEERDFIKEYLGPALRKEGYAKLKLIAWDHNRDLMLQRASVILNDPQAAQYVWGIGYHWYETWNGSPMQFENEKKVLEAFPNTHLIFTEGCKEKFSLDSVHNWSLGEKYATSMINDFNNGTTAWTDWNILLDEKGGPNHAGNYCFAPVHADTRTGALIYTNAFYYIGHFSKYIRPGAKRIVSSASRAGLLHTAFKNTDGSIALVLLNTGEAKQTFRIWLNNKVTELECAPHSISTLIIH
jgi:glucosylceramidase